MATEGGDIFVRVRADMGGFDRGMNQVEGRLHRVGGALGGFARAATRAGLVAGGLLAVGLGASVKTAADFERSMRNVNSIAKLNEDGFKSLGKSVLDMATSVGQKPKVLADGLYDIVSSGFKASAAVKILRVSAKAATAGLTDTATASKAVTAALNAYGWGANKARAVSDILFRTVDKGVLTFEELSQNMGDLVPIAAPLGVRLEEVGAAMSTLTLQGVPAAEAATRVKNTMIQLAKPSEDLAGLLLEAGFASGEAAVQSLGFAGVLELISEKTKGSVTETAKLTPEIRSLMGVVGLTGKNLATYKDNLLAMEDAQKGAGATAGVFAEQSKSLSLQMKKLDAAVDVIKVQIGNALIPVLRQGAEHVTRFLNRLSKAEGAGAKFRVVLDELKTVGLAAFGVVKSAFEAIDWGQVWSGVKVNAQAFVDKIHGALRTADWARITRAIADALVKGLEFSGKVATKITEELVQAATEVDWNKVGKEFAKKSPDLLKSLFLTGPGLIPAAADLTVKLARVLDPGSGPAAGIMKQIAGKYRQQGLSWAEAIDQGVKDGLTPELAVRVATLATQGVKTGTSQAVPAAQSGGREIGAGVATGAGWGLAGLGARMAAIATAEINAAMASVKSAFGIWSPSTVWKDRVGKPIGEGVLVGAVDGMVELPGKLTEKIGDAIEKARTAIEAARGKFSSAWSTLASDAMSAFDAVIGGKKTPAEKALAAMDRQDRLKSIADGIRDAKDALRDARAELEAFNTKLDTEAGSPISEGMLAGDAKTEQDRLKAAVLAAQESLTSAVRDKRRFSLEEKAADERKARDAYVNLERRHLEEDLAARAEAFAKGKTSLAQAQAETIKLLRSYGIDYGKAGAALGKSFVVGLKEALLGAAGKSGNIGAAIRIAAEGIVVPDVAGLAKGGIVTRPTLAMVGERGPEAVIPLTGGGAAAVGGGDTNIYITVKGSLIHERELGATVVRAVQDWSRLNGPVLSRTAFASA